MYAAARMNSAQAYGQMAVNSRVLGASPHELIQMLFDELDQQIGVALALLDVAHTERRGVAVNKAVALLQDGLRGGLDLERGGDLAAQLDALYDHCALRLSQAHLKRDAALFEAVRSELRTVADGWRGIRPQ